MVKDYPQLKRHRRLRLNRRVARSLEEGNHSSILAENLWIEEPGATVHRVAGVEPDMTEVT